MRRVGGIAHALSAHWPAGCSSYAGGLAPSRVPKGWQKVGPKTVSSKIMHRVQKSDGMCV